MVKKSYLIKKLTTTALAVISISILSSPVTYGMEYGIEEVEVAKVLVTLSQLNLGNKENQPPQSSKKRKNITEGTKGVTIFSDIETNRYVQFRPLEECKSRENVTDKPAKKLRGGKRWSLEEKKKVEETVDKHQGNYKRAAEELNECKENPRVYNGDMIGKQYRKIKNVVKKKGPRTPWTPEEKKKVEETMDKCRTYKEALQELNSFKEKQRIYNQSIVSEIYREIKKENNKNN